jgi:alpha-glucosidase
VARTFHVISSTDSTPIYLREGSLLPMQPGVRTSAANDLADIELHVILGSGSQDVATLDYVADDGLSYAYLHGARSTYRLRARRVDNTLELAVHALQSGWKPIRLRVVGYDGADRVSLTMGGKLSSLVLVPHPWRFSGGELPAAISELVGL